MKINKKFLQRIIKEEINSVIYGDSKKREVIRCFVEALKDHDEKKLYDSLKQIGVVPVEALLMLSMEEVDPDFYINSSEMHNAMVRWSGEGKEIKIEAFEDFPQSMSDPYTSAGRTVFKNKRTASSRNQLDTRKDRKNLTQS